MDMVILQGTTGEWPALSTSERLAMAAAWRQAVPAGSQMKLILHVGHDSLVDARLLAERAVSLRMDAVLISAPSKFIAHSAQHQAQAVVDIMAHCGSIPAFYCEPNRPSRRHFFLYGSLVIREHNYAFK